MSRVRNKDSVIERYFRKELWKRGFRYRKNSVKYFGKPDIILVKYKTVIFIDSCFWHGCKEHKTIPVSNRQFWVIKIENNKRRDMEVNKYYKQKEWHVIRIWEHDLSDVNLINKIINSIKA